MTAQGKALLADRRAEPSPEETSLRVPGTEGPLGRVGERWNGGEKFREAEHSVGIQAPKDPGLILSLTGTHRRVLD